MLKSKNAIRLKPYFYPKQQPSNRLKAVTGSLEDKILLCCARTAIDTNTVESLRVLLDKNIAWPTLIQSAIHHRIIPLLYHNLKKIDDVNIPENPLQKLQYLYGIIANHNLFLTAQLIQLIELFRAEHIAVIPYKGPTLAVKAYGNLCLRQFGDLDILVHSRDYPRAIKFLSRHGFQLDKDWGWECSLVDRTRRVCVDIHRALAPRSTFPIHLDVERFWMRLTPVSMAAGKMSTFCTEDLLIVLCIQLSKDASGQHPLRLSKLCDIAEVLRAHPGLDWDYIDAESGHLGCRRMVLLGLYLARELLDAPGPELPAHVTKATWLNDSAAYVCHKIFLPTGCSEKAILSSKAFHFKIRERWRDSLYPGFHTFKQRLIPNDRDFAFLKLPPSLHFFYYFIRPVRLAKDYGLQALQALKKKILN
ncbi:MAG: nucleotidyltransferase family protein [Gammaproteobacteria bacterium]